MNSNLEEFLFNSRAAQTMSELFALYEGQLENHGFDRLGYAVISDHPTLHNHATLGLIHQNHLNDWGDTYLENNYLEIDPAHKMAVTDPGIYRWADVVENKAITNDQLKIFTEAGEASLYHGATASSHGPGGTKTVAVISSSLRKASFDPRAFDIINIMTYQVHLCFLSLKKFEVPGKKYMLSDKEQEVLKWASKGLTKSEIGERLNTSPHTVDFHIRNTLKKLDAKNTAAALVTAIKEGVIVV